MPYSSFSLRNPDLFIDQRDNDHIEIIAPILGNNRLLSRTLTVQQFRNISLLETVLADLRRERDTLEQSLGERKSQDKPIG
ncbi:MULTISPECIES: hypothetical protein [Pseudomonas]|uniref:hypothetical protein n=1 Tax=Pseudomonas TaxID=286 RepID=UPI00249BB427|nr:MULTISPECIES: hypothetical protein [Pseudomonas]